MPNVLKKAAKLRSIISGWSNFVFENEAAEKVARLRAVECAKCPSAVKGWFDEYIGDEIKEVSGYVCNECTCPLSAKLRSNSESCPLNKWSAVS